MASSAARARGVFSMRTAPSTEPVSVPAHHDAAAAVQVDAHVLSLFFHLGLIPSFRVGWETTRVLCAFGSRRRKELSR